MKWTLQDLTITGGVGSETRVVLPVDLYPKPLLRRAAEKKNWSLADPRVHNLERSEECGLPL